MTTRFDSWLTSQPELPETCPQCDGPNSDDDGEWIAPRHIPFCSEFCEHLFGVIADEAERKAMTCPKCRRHFDEHVAVTKVDPEYGDYETYLCPIERLAPYTPPEGPPNPNSRTMSEVVFGTSQPGKETS